jgi:hypothetical protein
MLRGKIAVFVVADELSRASLVEYAANRICTAPVVPPLSPSSVRDTTLDHLETEIDITRQILGWAIVAAPSASDKRTLKVFDARLETFDRTVFGIRHRGDPQAKYSPPGFPPPQRHPFKDTVQSLEGEVPAAKFQLTQAEAAVQSSDDRQILKQQGAVFDHLIRAAEAMLSGS